MNHKAIFGLSFLAAVTIAGCGSASRTVNTGLVGSMNLPTASLVLPDHLTLTLTEDKATATVGSAVTYQVSLTNTTSAAITSNYVFFDSFSSTTTGATFSVLGDSLTVKDTEGTLIGTNGGIFDPPPLLAPEFGPVTLQPGQSLTTTATYTYTRASTYTVTASVYATQAINMPETAGPLRVIVQ